MKLWIPISILAIAVTTLCLWDLFYSKEIFTTLKTKSNQILATLETTEITDESLQNEIIELTNYWTKKMDILSISISRKDMQPVSDYLQYLCGAIENSNQEDAITYSRLLNYNILGLQETSGISWINIL